MPYDATKLKDWQISEEAEKNMPTPWEWQEKLGLKKDEILPMGRLCKLDFLKIMERLKDRPDGKYIEVTAITPTPLGRGQEHHFLRPYGRPGDARSQCRRVLAAAVGRADDECQGNRSRWRQFAPDPDDRILHGAHGRHQRHHECSQSGHGGPDRPDAARAELQRRTTAAAHQDAPPGHRSHPGGNGLDHGFLCPVPAQYRHRHGRPDGRLHDAIQVRDCGQLRADGDSLHRQRPG